jgi:ABC-2 type transport system permease protein
MADLDKSRNAQVRVDGSGAFSQLARGQYAALAAMRVRLFVNSFRTTAGAFELGARTISFFIYSLMGLGLGTAAGAIAYSLVFHQRWQFVSVEFWIVCILWLAIAVALVSFQEQYDLSGLLQFPVNFKTFFLLSLIFGLVDVSTIVGGLCCVGILAGITFARTDLLGLTLAAVAGLAAFNILLVRAVLAWIDRWLAKRRSREIVSALFLVAMLSLQLLNPIVREQGPRRQHHSERNGTPNAPARELPPWVNKVESVQAWLPPGLAAAILQRAKDPTAATEAESLGVLGLYVLLTGGLLGIRLRAEYRGENLGEAPARRNQGESSSVWLISGSGPVAAQIEKELRTMLRSMPQLYSVGVPMLMVFVIASLFRNGASMTREPFHLALPVCVAYGLLGFTQLIYNNLGGEGRAIQMLFLFPVPIRTVLLGKNLFHAMLYVLVALISGFLASLRMGRPGAVMIAATIGWLAFALPANLAAGNVLSLTMAYRVNLGRIGRQSGSQANALLSMLIQTLILGVGAAVIGLSTIFDKSWLAAPVFSVLACVSLLGWVLVLRNADRIAFQRRDTLIAKLARIE